MIFNWCEIKNFKSYGDYETRVPLNVNESRLLLGENGCLSGETIVSFNRCKKGFKKTIEKAYKSWNGITYQGSSGEWDKSEPTYIRAYKKEDSEISLHKIKDIVYSGEKEVYLLTTEDEKQIKATEDHKFLTIDGWKRLNELNELFSIMIDEINPIKNNEKTEKIIDKEIYGIKYHKFSKKETWDSKINSYKTYYRLPIHRLIFEANENGLSLEEYIYILRNDEIKSSVLKAFDTNIYDIHHMDSNHFNNSILNLKLLTKKEHLLKHGESSYKNFGNFSPEYKKIKSIIKIGKEKTYDIVCEEPYRNFSANGIIVHNSGKTTFVDAIIWALYGKSLSNVDEIINRKTKINCKVEVNFDIGDINYSIIRYRNHEIHKNSVLVFRDKENISPRTANEVQALILDIIEINYNAMVSSIIFSSELYISFLRSKPSDRLRIFENILSLKEIQLYHNIIKEMRKPIRSELDESTLEKEKSKHEIEFTNNTITDYKEKVKNKLREFKEKKEILIVETDRIKKDLETISHINVDEELTKNERIDEAKKQNKLVNEKISKELLQLKDIDIIVNTLTIMKNELSELLEIDVEEEKKKNSEHERIKQNNINVETQIQMLTSSIIDIDKIRDEISKLEIRKTEIEKNIKELEENAEKCPTCGQKVEIDLTQKLIVKKKQLNNTIEESIDKLDVEKYGAIESNRDTVDKIRDTNSKLEDLKTPSKYNDDYLNALRKRIEEKQSDVKLKEQEIIHNEEVNDGVKENVIEITSLLINEKEIENSAYNTDYLKSIRDNTDKYNERITEIENEVKVINAQAISTYDKSYVGKLESKISKIIALLKKIDKKIAEITERDNHYDVLQQLFSNKSIGVKKYIIDNMLHVFNEKVNFYLPFFFDSDTVINFSKDLEEEITVNDVPVSFTTFSSGEKTRLELAIAFSLFMVVKTFFSSSVNLLIFDEILDMNLDSSGVESVLNIINNLSEDNSIIVISHRDEYKENFANQITLSKDSEGFSRLTTR